MKPKVYLETSVISYLIAWRSRDLVIAGNQETTKEWWDRKDDFDLYVSQFVLDETGSGDESAAQSRLAAISDVPEIAITQETIQVASALIITAKLPEKARIDALHIAVAACGGMDYLLTWNCTHIANPFLKPKVEYVIRSFGFEPPVICTPQELLEV